MSERYFTERTDQWGYVIRDREQMLMRAMTPKSEKSEPKAKIVAAHIESKALADRMVAMLNKDTRTNDELVDEVRRASSFMYDDDDWLTRPYETSLHASRELDTALTELVRRLEEAQALSCENTRGEGCCPLQPGFDALRAAVREAVRGESDE